MKTFVCLMLVALSALAHPQTSPRPLGQRGVVYLRTDPFTGRQYVGQVKFQDRFEARVNEHNEKLQKSTGTKAVYEFKVLSRPLSAETNIVEEGFIRKMGGLEGLENRRHQVKNFDGEVEVRRGESAIERYERRLADAARDRRMSDTNRERLIREMEARLREARRFEAQRREYTGRKRKG